MRTKLLFLVLTICIAVFLCFSVSAMEGSGTENDPYIVETAEDFVSIKSNLGACYKLNSDLTLSSDTGAIVEGTFSGVFDGNGHKITLAISGATSGTNTFDSLFGVASGTVKNLTTYGSVTGSDKVSAVVGKLTGNGNVDNCVNYASISGRKNIGGIVGLIIDYATVTSCANFGSITGTSPVSNGLDMGGIVGCIWNDGKNLVVISNCFNAGTIYGNGYNVAGICGHISGGKFENIFNIGEVFSTSGSAGGLLNELAGNFDGFSISGYFTSTKMPVLNGSNKKIALTKPLIESTGVSIYLGSGSGIRGEFHVNEETLAAFNKFLTFGNMSIEYGAIVSTKDVILSQNGNLIDSEENDKIVFAPALLNGEKQYFYNDEAKGEGYHSFRFALTGFPDNKEAYNMEFVILGYILLTNGDSKEIITINTVISDRLASEVGETGLNAVSIVRVAEATLADGDFNGNDTAINALNNIVAYRDFATKIDIDGLVGYGHKSAKFTKSISSDNTVVFKITSTDNSEFVSYIYDLIKNGYKKVMENNINGNLYYTFTKDELLINAVYNIGTNEVFVTRESLTALPENLTAPSYEKKNDPSITQIKLEASIPEGMSYVVKLSDGTFFIIDGGWCDDNNNESDKLYNTLVALAGEGNDIVIAGWIFTHCHGDHIGTFNLFVEKYHDKVTINQLLYNFPSDEDILKSASSYMIDNSNQRYTKFRSVISTYLKDTEIVKIHSGYKFYYADLEVEILQTLEDLYPSTVANYDFNSSSTVFTLTIGGQKMLFVGDISDVAASKLNSTYGSSLKSDFVQIAHHGLNNTGTIKNMYINADATYVFYPAPTSWFTGNGGSGANFYIEIESKSVRQIFVSGYSTFTLSLPYGGTLFDGAKVPGKEVIVPDDEDRTEVERPEATVKVPDAYFDLDLTGGQISDSKGNATVTVHGGAVSETTVTHDGESTTANAYTGDRYKEHYYLDVDMNEINTEAEWANFVMSGTTFEIFLKLDKLPGSTVGLITSCNSGGITLYLRKQAGGQLNFQIGSTSPNANSDGGEGKGNYSAVVNMNGDEPLAVAGELLHVVGSYNSDTNMMKLYINGILVAEADFGPGDMKLGNDNDCVIGIGHNPQYSGEDISSYTNYELYEAKIYNTALTDEQVAQEYWNCIDALMAKGE